MGAGSDRDPHLLKLAQRVSGRKNRNVYDSCTYWSYILYFIRLNGPQMTTMSFSRTVRLGDNMREEVAQFVVANHYPELPDITELKAMRRVPRDGVKWGKMTVNGERITASWA